jgi:voltage-gated potassium channel
VTDAIPTQPWLQRVFHLRVVVIVTVVTAVIVAGAAWAMWLLERDHPGSNIHSYPNALWWAMETVTTVGYGDHHPVTTAGRFVASGLMVVGLALVGVITATVVTWFFAELDLVREMRVLESEEERSEATAEQMLAMLTSLDDRLARLEEELRSRGPR